MMFVIVTACIKAIRDGTTIGFSNNFLHFKANEMLIPPPF